MSKLPYKPRLKKPERRAEIERAGAELFATRGYDASSVEEIAHAAGVSKRVLYDHYESKSALHIALLETHTDALIRFIASEIGTGSAPYVRMAAGVGAFFRFVEEHPFAWRMLFRDAPTEPLIAFAHAEAQQRATAAIASFLASERQIELIRRQRSTQWLEMLAELLKTSLNGLAGWWYEHQHVPREEVVATALDFAWSGLRTFAESTSD